MLARVVEEETEAHCCGDGGTDGEGIINVWETTNGSNFIQVLGKNVVILQRLLDGSGIESMEGTGKVGMNGESLGEGGIRWDNNRDILCGGGASGPSVWVRYMGDDHPDGEVPQGFPPPGGTVDGGHGPQTLMGWDMGVPTHWGGAGNSGAV